MVICDFCRKSVDGLPHSCRYCGKVHCSAHLLPENHNCENLVRPKTFLERINQRKKNLQERDQKPFIIKPIRFKSKKSVKPSPQKYSSIESIPYENDKIIKPANIEKLNHTGPVLFLILLAIILIVVFIVLNKTPIGDQTSFKILELVNDLREQNNLKTLDYNHKAYDMAVQISKEFFNQPANNYLGLSSQFGLTNISVIMGYLDENKSESNLVSQWNLRGDYQKNLLEERNQEGAVGCYESKCTLIIILSDKPNTSSLIINPPKEKNNLYKEDSKDIVPINTDKYASYKTEPKTIRLIGVGDFLVYRGVKDYLEEIPESISYYYIAPTTKDFILKDLDDKIQKEFLAPLVDLIKSKNLNKKTQADIAIRMVQGIPYDWDSFYSVNSNIRYPYEVLYDYEGVCGEKSELLAYLLRDLGFGVAIFEFEKESHRAVGIKCQNGNYGSDYCFIESTDYYPLGQIPYEYVGGVDIRGATPELVIISEGYSYN